MATTLNFGTPESATARPVTVSGTVARNSIGYLTITLNVTSSVSANRNRSFYREIIFDNTAGNTAQVITNNSYTLSIVPKLLSMDTVVAVAAWSYTPNA